MKIYQKNYFKLEDFIDSLPLGHYMLAEPCGHSQIAVWQFEKDQILKYKERRDQILEELRAYFGPDTQAYISVHNVYRKKQIYSWVAPGRGCCASAGIDLDRPTGEFGAGWSDSVGQCKGFSPWVKTLAEAEEWLRVHCPWDEVKKEMTERREKRK